MESARKVKILSCLFLLSLAGNVGMISWLAGKRTGGIMQTVGVHIIETTIDTLRTLPPEQRIMALDEVGKHTPELTKAIESMRDQRRSIMDQLKAEEISRQELSDSFAEMRRRTGALQEAGQSMAMDILLRLPAEQRRALVERQEKMLR